jgi:hypothetical protein
LKKYIFISIVLSILAVLTACEKIIDIDLSDSKEVIVIEATITNVKSPITVLVSKTSTYLGSKTNNPVSGAKVSIRTEKGSPNYFVETMPGEYVFPNPPMSINLWYICEVEYEGITYTARSFLNDKVPIADMKFTYFDGLGFFDSGYKVACFIKDPVRVENYYRLKYYANGRQVDDHGDLTIFSDKLFNGKVVGLNHGSFVFRKTDTLVVEVQTIDKAAYDYYSTLKAISGFEAFESASPSNPISNFDNGALGFFTAYSYERRKMIIQDYLTE